MFTGESGFVIKQATSHYHKPQRFVFRNGLKIEENLLDKKPKISRASYLVGNDSFNYNNIPNLTFSAFYREKLGEEEKSTTRFHKCNISYFLEDDEMKIYEPCNKNSGSSQGCIVSKGKFKNPEGGYYTIDDLNIGNILVVNGREYTLISCDAFTRNFLTEMGFRVRSPQPDVYDAIAMDRDEANTPKSYRKPFVKEYKVANFLKYHPKKLRFYGYYGDGRNLFEERKEVTLYYDLACGKIKLVEERGRKEENAVTSVILRPTLVPKRMTPSLWIGEMGDPTLLNLAHDVKTVLIGGQYYKIHNPASGLADSNPLDGRRKIIDYYTDMDLELGVPLNIYNSVVLLHDCDEFTKNYYRYTYKKELVPIPRPEEKVHYKHQLIYPQEGAGEPEQTMGLHNFFYPKPKNKDLLNYFKHSGYGYNANQFKFFSRAITDDPVEKLHRFVVCFFLEDDTMSIRTLDNHHDSSFEFPAFKRVKVTKPQSTNENSGRCFYRPLDMYVGNVIYVRGKPFELLEADEYTYDYMERHADVFPLSNVRLIMANFKEWIPSKLQPIKSRFEELDESRIGTVDYSNFKDVIYAKMPEELKVKFPEHAIKTAARYYAEDRYIGLKLKDLTARVHAELCRKKFHDFENLNLAFSIYDHEKLNFLDPDRVYYILRTTSLPINRDLLKSFIYKFPKTENKINYTDIVKAMNWMTSPSCFSNSEPYAIQINWERVQTEKDLSRIKYDSFMMDATPS